MSHQQNLPVVVSSSSSTALTQAHAYALADLWVSEHNRLPFQLSTGARPQRSDALYDFTIAAWYWRRIANVVSRGIHRLRRFVVRRVERDGFALDAAVERRLRRAFDEALADTRVRAMSDSEQRRHLGEVLFAAQ